MSRQQTLPFTEDTSTCSQADSPASHSASQASAKARTITATYGQRCCEQFERLSHVGLWAKMFSVLLIGWTEWYSSRCNLIWRMRGTKCNRILFRLAPSMRPIDVTECGLSPTVGMLKTPPAMDSRESLATAKKNPSSGNSGCLAQEIANGYATKRGLLLPTVVTQGLKYCKEKGQSEFVNPQFLPTPNATEVDHSQKKWNPKSQRGRDLTAMAVNGMLPTPAARDWKGRTNPGIKKKGCGNIYGETLPDVIYKTSQNSQLSPLFVAEMMGFPIDWTLAPFLNGLKSTNDGDSAVGGEKNQLKPMEMQ